MKIVAEGDAYFDEYPVSRLLGHPDTNYIMDIEAGRDVNKKELRSTFSSAMTAKDAAMASATKMQHRFFIYDDETKIVIDGYIIWNGEYSNSKFKIDGQVILPEKVVKIEVPQPNSPGYWYTLLNDKNSEKVIKEILIRYGNAKKRIRVTMDQAAVANVVPADYGGIDLNTADMGMTVRKDVNGGVKVDFDPAMIERIRKDGVQNVVPLIINVTPMTVADIRPLLGLAPSREEEEKLAGV